jgi:hypothetical protein
MPYKKIIYRDKCYDVRLNKNNICNIIKLNFIPF